MKKKGIARIGTIMSCLAAKKLREYNYNRQLDPEWNVKVNEHVLLSNVNIIDVNQGKIRDERAVLIADNKIVKLVFQKDVDEIKKNVPIKKEVDGQGHYLIPGLSDLHGHLTCISEFDLSFGGLYYFDAQRQKNCEETLKSGCTFVRDSGGAYVPTKYLQDEIEGDRLLGPKIMPSYEVMTPKKPLKIFKKQEQKWELVRMEELLLLL